ncbi:MAG: RsmD family RNA methyltransferase [Nitrospina sp.]|nr:RsmD family RNA methyltransferase [Nitrospina sp.]
MRIIAGKFKGRQLAPLGGAELRPTLDRVRESVFSILAGRTPGARVLDLFAGNRRGGAGGAQPWRGTCGFCRARPGGAKSHPQEYGKMWRRRRFGNASFLHGAKSAWDAGPAGGGVRSGLRRSPFRRGAVRAHPESFGGVSGCAFRLLGAGRALPQGRVGRQLW